jgi:hypothetical protein
MRLTVRVDYARSLHVFVRIPVFLYTACQVEKFSGLFIEKLLKLKELRYDMVLPEEISESVIRL